MNQTTTKEKLSHMFFKVNDKLAFCKLCSKHIELAEPIEIEFWKHQFVKDHLEYLIHYFMFNQQAERKQCTNKKKNSYETNYFADEINFVKQKQKTFKTLNKRQKLISSTFLEQQNQFLQNQNSSEQESSKHSVSEHKSQLNLLDQEPRISRFNQSMLKYKVFKIMTEKYFVDLIKKLKDKLLYVEAICYILARIGTTAQELCCISLQKIESEVIEKSKTNSIFITKQILEMFNEMFPIVKQQFEKKNEGYLFQQPVSNERVQDFLLRAKKKLMAAENDEEFRKFLKKVQIRCFNSQYNQKKYLSRQMKKNNITQEGNEKKNRPQQLNDQSDEHNFQLQL